MSIEASHQLLQECKIQFEGVKLEIDKFISSVKPTDSETERKRVWEDLDKILHPIQPIIKTLVDFSTKNPNNNSDERMLTHEIKDYMRSIAEEVLHAINPNEVFY